MLVADEHTCSSPSPPPLPPDDLKKLRMSCGRNDHDVEQAASKFDATHFITLWTLRATALQMITYHRQATRLATLSSS
jgi:hypothetical protein